MTLESTSFDGLLLSSTLMKPKDCVPKDCVPKDRVKPKDCEMRLRNAFAALFVVTLVAVTLLVVPGSEAQTAAHDEAQATPPTGTIEAAPAYHLQEGSVARRRIVALGQDLVIDGEALSHAVALGGSARISGRVIGDVIVLDGDVLLTKTAQVGGDVYVLSGRIDAAPGAAIGGRSVAYPDASALWVSLIQGPALGLPSSSPVVLGAKLALLAFWALVILLLFGIGRRELLSTSDSVRIEPFRNFFVGLVGVLTMVLTALFFNAFSGAMLGLPLVVLVVVVALVLRFWGMVAVFHALGDWVSQRFEIRPPLPLTAATYGLVILGVLKFLPWVGIWTWSVATFIGVGAALSTKLGRREAWFEPA